MALLGDDGVGKSDLIESEMSSIEQSGRWRKDCVSLSERTYPDNFNVKYLHIPGAPRFIAIAKRYCAVAAAIVLLFTTLHHLLIPNCRFLYSISTITKVSLAFKIGLEPLPILNIAACSSSLTPTMILHQVLHSWENFNHSD